MGGLEGPRHGSALGSVSVSGAGGEGGPTVGGRLVEAAVVDLPPGDLLLLRALSTAALAKRLRPDPEAVGASEATGAKAL